MSLSQFLFETPESNILHSTGLENVCAAPQYGTHFIQTCRIGGNGFHLKFSANDDLEGYGDLQILVEYLAYRIYGLYPGVRIPRDVRLVYDEGKGVIGLATQTVEGVIGKKVDPAALGKMLSAGVFVDIFLANWDQKPANVIVKGDSATRIDPGAALTFRAAGGRKGGAFNTQAKELTTMLDPNIRGSGWFLQHADLNQAAKEFLKVSWEQVEQKINETEEEVSAFLSSKNLSNLLSLWKKDVGEIRDTLNARHKTVTAHVEFVLSTSP